MSTELSNTVPLFNEIKALIDSARQRAAVAVNAELTLLYWQVGQCIHSEVLGGERAEYGKQVIAGLSRELTTVYGKGWSRKQLHHCLRFAETFPDQESVSALRRKLSWTHLKALIYIDAPLKRGFYTQMAALEGWSTRTLSERIDSMLFERSALSKKPEETIRLELQALAEKGDMSFVGRGSPRQFRGTAGVGASPDLRLPLPSAEEATGAPCIVQYPDR